MRKNYTSIVAREIAEGKIDEDLWLKCLLNEKGNKEAAKLIYIKSRTNEIEIESNKIKSKMIIDGIAITIFFAILTLLSMRTVVAYEDNPGMRVVYWWASGLALYNGLVFVIKRNNGKIMKMSTVMRENRFSQSKSAINTWADSQ